MEIMKMATMGLIPIILAWALGMSMAFYKSQNECVLQHNTLNERITDLLSRNLELASSIDENSAKNEELRMINQDLVEENKELESRLSDSKSDLNRIESLLILMYEKDEPVTIVNTTIIVKDNKKIAGLPRFNIPEDQKTIQNLSSENDRWQEFCYQQRLTNTTLCYRLV